MSSSASDQDMADQNTIVAGDHVIFKTDDKTKVFQLQKDRQIFFEKIKFKGGEIIGQKYGTQFDMQNGQLVILTPEPVIAPSSESAAATEAGKDNRDLVASGENQKLKQEDIQKMKEEGVSGQGIVEKLVQQSETFKTKTEFSQEKYIKKKKKKYMTVFRVLRPCSSLLLEVFKPHPGKICNLRADSMSQMLSYSNVMSGLTVGVVESCQGLVIGSVMERMAGKGKVLHLYPSNDRNRNMVNEFNFPEHHKQMLLDFPFTKLALFEDGTLFSKAPTDNVGDESQAKRQSCAGNNGDAPDKSADAMDVVEKEKESGTVGDKASETVVDKESKSVGDKESKSVGDKESKSVDDKESETVGDNKSGGDDDKKLGGDGDKKSGGDGDKKSGGDGDKKVDGDGDKEESRMEEGGDGEEKEAGESPAGNKRKAEEGPKDPVRMNKKKTMQLEKLREAAAILQEKSLDSLIIATKQDPLAILRRLLPYVGPSRPVVVYSQHKEPLVECFTFVKDSCAGVQIKLAESFYREYQVLPSRTHPLNNMSGTGGYLLTFIRITDKPADQD